ncbi:hypothetical protein EDC96DRAFT_230706 [Choanephora cucurbitarum]|nr:hypothetical protein EDC96DRAFT_230706 [Choanephora cucurbitarum]
MSIRNTSRPYMEFELLAEIFESIPEHGLNDLYELSNALSYKVIEGIADRLTTACPEKRREIEMALEKYEIGVEKGLDTSFNTLQQYASQVVWHIPPTLDIQLDHYKQVAMDKDTEKIDEKLDELRNEVLKQKKLQALLAYQHSRLSKENKAIDEHLEAFAFISRIPKHEHVPNPDRDFKFIKDQLDTMATDIVKLGQALKKEKTMRDRIHMTEMEQTERVRARIEALLSQD